MRQGGRRGGGSPGQGAADSQTVQVVHSCIPLRIARHFSKTPFCSAEQCILVSQCTNLCCAAVCQWKYTSASVEPDLKVTPAKVLFYKPTSLDSTCSLCPQDCWKAFRATLQTLPSSCRLCTSCCCCRINGLGDIGLWSGGGAGAWTE